MVSSRRLGGMLMGAPLSPARDAPAPAATQPPLERFELAVEGPQALPGKVRALLTGREGAPLLIVLGGISATAAVVRDEDSTPGWWTRLFGAGRPLDTADYRILGIDFLADDSGVYAPSTHEQAAIVDAAIARFGSPHGIVGASYGGMVALAWAERSGNSTPKLAIVSANAEPHPMGTANRALQRQVVALGQRNGCVDEALAIARGMAMLTYRTPQEFAERFAGGLRDGDPLGGTDPGAYLAARGQSFVERMPPGRFLSLSASIDRHRVDPGRIANPALVVSVSSDQLVPPSQCADLARRLAGPARLETIDSLYGHDAFLKELRVGELVAEFLA